MTRRRVLCVALLAVVPAMWALATGLGTLGSGAARAQDEAPRLTPKGDLLLRATPKQADLVVHTNDLPALLSSASSAGLGSATAWKAAFKAQIAAWCETADGSDALVAASQGLLAAADGEVLAASLYLPIARTPARYTLLALRSSKSEAQLTKDLEAVIDVGLRSRYPGDLTDERIGDRTVRSLAGVHKRLYFVVQDGLLVVTDHALPMGLFLRELERAASTKPPGPAAAAAPPLRLEVRYGPPKSRWTGWMFGKGESVSWPEKEAQAAIAAPMATQTDDRRRIVGGVALHPLRDVPVVSAPPPQWFTQHAAALNQLAPEGAGLLQRDDGRFMLTATAKITVEQAKSLSQTLGVPVRRTDEGFTVNGAALDANARSMFGFARRLGWMRAQTQGGAPLTLPTLDRRHLAPVWESVSKSAAPQGTPRDGVLLWRSGDRAGELRGPAWHGPTTFLALRTLHHLARGMAPGSTTLPRDVKPKPIPGAPLPAPEAPTPPTDPPKDDEGK